MRQDWRELTFLHFPLPPSEVQALLPAGLDVDTFPDDLGNEMAWIGLVPFRMQNVHPTGLPSVPGLSHFPETNVRTYVHRQRKRPGVWFFSLEAANRLACWIARQTFGLPYWHAEMSVERTSDALRYHSRRFADDARADVAVKPKGVPTEAEPGTLDFFLVERYLLYARHRGELWEGRVHHAPYQVSNADVLSVDETLTKATGVLPRPYIHSRFSAGVNVEVFAIYPSF